MHANREQRVPIGIECALVQVDQRCESLRRPPDDGQHQRQTKARGADHRLRTATDTNPCRQVPLWEWRAQVLVCERSAEGAGPRDRLAAHEAREEIEFLLEELLIVGEVESEERERLRQRTATDDELCTA